MFYDYRSSTFADIKHLETADPDSETGYRGVYKVAGSYHAKAFKKRVSPVCNSPREAARYAAAWWHLRCQLARDLPGPGGTGLGDVP